MSPAPAEKSTTHVPSAYSYRNTAPAKVLNSSDESSGEDGSDDENCHRRLSAKRHKSSMYHDRDDSRTAEQTEQLRSSDFYRKLTEAQTPATAAQPPPAKPKRKRNNVWANIAQEQTLVDEIGTVGLKKLTGDRNVENYDFEMAQQLAREMEEAAYGEEGEFHGGESAGDMERRLSRKRPRQQHARRPPPVQVDASHGEPIELPRLVDVEDMSDEQLSETIAENLQEQKPEIIGNIVRVLGRAVAIRLYEETCVKERDGGLLIVAGNRRRTSGGVYLYLTRGECKTDEQKAQIFPQQENQAWKKQRRAAQRRRKMQGNQRQHQQPPRPQEPVPPKFPLTPCPDKEEGELEEEEMEESKPVQDAEMEEGEVRTEDEEGEVRSEEEGSGKGGPEEGSQCPDTTPVSTPCASDDSSS